MADENTTAAPPENTTASTHESTTAAEKPKASRSRGRRRPSQAPAGPRAAIEMGEGSPIPVGPMDTLTVEQAAELAKGVPEEIVDNMEEMRIRRKLGQEVDTYDRLDQDKVREAHEDEVNRPLGAALGGSKTAPVVFSEGAANEAMIRERPAEKVGDDARFAAPGLTERGWSAEVTARHPEVMAATMRELQAEGDNFEPIDPHDPVAVENALTEQGFAEVRRDMLRAEAARVGATKLAAATGARANAGTHAQAAQADAVERAEYEASVRGGTAPPNPRDIERSRD